MKCILSEMSIRAWVLLSLALLTMLSGCREADAPVTPPVVKKARRAKATTPPPAAAPITATNAEKSSRVAPPLAPGGLADLLKSPEAVNFHTALPIPAIDDDQAAAHGIRKLVGKHLTLYTDLPASPEVDELPHVFDLAAPQWGKYFAVPADKVETWRIWGYLIQDKSKFEKAGLYPDDLPEFTNGFQRGHEFWLNEQSTPYYRRHLMLHEGTHAAMFHWLGGAGPPWYCEGMAELFGTHQWRDGKLTLAYNPQTKEEVPGWGRMRVIQDAYQERRALMLHEVLRLPPNSHLNPEAYAWSWAAAAFFNNHPRYGAPFRELRRQAQDVSVDFTTDFLEQFREDARVMQTEWQLFVGNAEYGYDVERSALEVKPASPLPADGSTAEVSAQRGWQSTGITLEQGSTYEVAAKGRYRLGNEPKSWWCEPGGVTIRYHRGLPLGMLVAAVRDDENPASPSELLRPTPIGARANLTPTTSGTLWLKINEHDGEWADNDGALNVTVTPVK